MLYAGLVVDPVLRHGAHRIRLAPGLSRLGRDPACEVQLADDSVSRRHAVVRVERGFAVLSDDASRNGVNINGAKLRGPHVLQHGDRIQVGTVELCFEREEGEQQDAPFGGNTKPVPKLGPSPLDALSPRERDVLGRLARGESYRNVAEALGVSVKTVETYRTRIGEKLGVRERQELVKLALEAGLLSPPPTT